MDRPRTSSALGSLLARAVARRKPLLEGVGKSPSPVGACRIFSGEADGMDGVFIDVYQSEQARGAVLIAYEGRVPRGFDAHAEAGIVLRGLRSLDVTAVYVKHFARDRSKLGGELPPEVADPVPAAGDALPEAMLIREHGWTLEVRLYDGLSTGIFLDQRDNRAWVASWVAARRKAFNSTQVSVLNTFAYTCAFSVAAGTAGAATTSVDVSPRYLDWGKRNFAHSGMQAGVDDGTHRFARMDTFEFFAYAARKKLTYDLIILDPPSFSAGSKKKGIKAWSSVDDYARLVGEAARLLRPRGAIFASTNTHELCRPGRLEREILTGLESVGYRGKPHGITLPPMPIDFAADRERFAALAFSI
jgi:23S rRNA (cytosine1962-C5)-methyltransferase